MDEVLLIEPWETRTWLLCSEALIFINLVLGLESVKFDKAGNLCQALLLGYFFVSELALLVHPSGGLFR